MTSKANKHEDFLDKVKRLVLARVGDEQFGVSELAAEMHMSRSNLLRKIKKETDLSASQYIRLIRLERARELLLLNTHNVSEIAELVGFGSASYFIKCYREQFGNPPGADAKQAVEVEVTKPMQEATHVEEEAPKTSHRKWSPISISLVALSFLVLSAVVFFAIRIYSPPENAAVYHEKSIAVLPFKNESNDSSNTYFVNGLMEATLSNLQKIEDFRVVSRTSSEKIATAQMTLSEIAKALRVNYIVEGSGQRLGDKVLLNIQLIDAATDQHLWSGQYNRKVDDVFALQNEVAYQIATAVQAVVKPTEHEQIDKKPTNNLAAYECYLQGLDFYNKRSSGQLDTAIALFKKATVLDHEFALAYAMTAMAYYFKDEFQRSKQYTLQLNNCADKALLYDPKLTESLIAKALYYMQIDEFALAVPHLEKALEYNPNSPTVVQMLANLYAQAIPNTAKYLEYTLMGIKIDIEANDSVTKSYIYLHLANALVQAGFVDEALLYIDKSMSFFSENPYAGFAMAYMLFARNGSINHTKNLLLCELAKDNYRPDLLQEAGKMYYYLENYDSAYFYYKKFMEIKDAKGLNIYPQEDQKIGIVYEKMGLNEDAQRLYDAYNAYCAADESIYKNASVAMKHAREGDMEKALEYLGAFADESDNFQYWMLLFLDKDPVLNTIKSTPEFRRIMQRMRVKFWENHDRLKARLRGLRLLEY